MSLSIHAARPVLSMNCGHNIIFRVIDNELILTACSPIRTCGQLVNNAIDSINSTSLEFSAAELFTEFPDQKSACEQVSFLIFGKTRVRQEKFPERRVGSGRGATTDNSPPFQRQVNRPNEPLPGETVEFFAPPISVAPLGLTLLPFKSCG
jgi:hypothetical protein